MHKIGPLIAPTPKINCKPPPAATNLDLGTKSFVWARFRENNGRQKDDKSWAELLNRLREGNHTDIDIKTLKSMILSPKHPDYPINGPHLFQSNAKVYAHNDEYFERNHQFSISIQDF